MMVLCCVFSVPVDFFYWVLILFRWRVAMYHIAPGLTTHLALWEVLSKKWKNWT
jgi:hypothetical protein